MVQDKERLKNSKIVAHYRSLFEFKGDIIKHMNLQKETLLELDLSLKKIRNFLKLPSSLTIVETLKEVKKKLGMKQTSLVLKLDKHRPSKNSKAGLRYANNTFVEE